VAKEILPTLEAIRESDIGKPLNYELIAVEAVLRWARRGGSSM
jgi:hypothetical protein